MFFKSYYSGYRERNKEKGYVVNVRFNSIQSPESMNRLLSISPIISNDTGFDGSSRYTPQTKRKHFDNDFEDTANRKVQKLDNPVSSKRKRDDNDLEEQQIKRISLF